MKQERPTPKIIEEINQSLKSITFEDGHHPTVEVIGGKLGVSKDILYMWLEEDEEFSTALTNLIEVHENDPFKTSTIEDSQVQAMMITLLLIETIDRHYKSDNN